MFPIYHKTKLKTWHVAVSLVCVWMSGIIEKLGFISYPTLVVEGQCILAAGYGGYVRALIAASINTVTQFFLPLFLILLMYCHMVWLLRKRARQVGPSGELQVHQVHNSTSGDTQTERASKNVTKTLIVVTMFFFFCWIWNSIFVLLFLDGSYGLSLDMPFYHFSTYMVFINAIINPFIYTFKYRKFRSQVLKVFCKRFATRFDDESSQNYSQT